MCWTPAEVTVTGIVYVPAGVAFAVDSPLVPPPGPPPEPPPELVQLDTLPIRIARIAPIHRDLRRFHHPNGNNRSPHTTGIALHRTGLFERATATD